MEGRGERVPVYCRQQLSLYDKAGPDIGDCGEYAKSQGKKGRERLDRASGISRRIPAEDLQPSGYAVEKQEREGCCCVNSDKRKY